MNEQRTGIIDIGSNSVRLVIYERTASGAYRVIDGSKRPARLSENIDSSGNLTQEALSRLVDTVNHFLMICSHHQTGFIRAVATAAIRNAANGKAVLAHIEAKTGLALEELSGEEEAYYGFLGMINAIDIDSGFLVDIGGGSTEVSLFRNRELVKSVSFPFGCVSLNRRFGTGGPADGSALKALEAHVAGAVAKEPWIAEARGLPLVGVGGTVRALGKMHQAVHKYPFALNHNYRVEAADVASLTDELAKLPLDKRHKFPGLSKDRADVIVPGLAILQILFRAMGASHYLICGTGLRDGLFHATRSPSRPRLDDVLAFSVENLRRLYPGAPQLHAEQVERLALQLLETLRELHPLPNNARMLLGTAARLSRIGASIDYYDYARHTFYLIVNSNLNGLTHREIMLLAAIASYKSKNRLRQQLSDYKALLDEADFRTVLLLGTLLQLAAALDRSETQAIGGLETDLIPLSLRLKPLGPKGKIHWEQSEVQELASDFMKAWGVAPVLLDPDLG